jgi:hypothetical protein
MTALQDASAVRSVSIRTLAGSMSGLSLPHATATADRARSREASLRAQRTTSPCCAAHAARPQAIVPLPTTELLVERDGLVGDDAPGVERRHQ